MPNADNAPTSDRAVGYGTLRLTWTDPKLWNRDSCWTLELALPLCRLKSVAMATASASWSRPWNETMVSRSMELRPRVERQEKIMPRRASGGDSWTQTSEIADQFCVAERSRGVAEPDP